MLRLLELYTSVQGECDRTGTPTTFVRFAGCNLTCAAWPCDSQFAIDPKLYRKEQQLVTPSDLLTTVDNLANETGTTNICLTGGEPALQPMGDLEAVVLPARHVYGYDLEMFSNGTLPYSEQLLSRCAVRLDWKLPGSGEAQSGKLWHQRIENYYAMSEYGHHTIKFTIKDVKDFEAARDIYEKFDMSAWPGSIYAGPVWGSNFTARDIVDGILTYKLPWKLNIQAHQYIWPANERGR